MESLFSVSNKPQDISRPVGYCDQCLLINGRVMYASFYSYNSSTFNFKKPVINTSNRSPAIPLYLNIDNKRSLFVSCSHRDDLQVKIEKISNTGISNIVWYMKKNTNYSNDSHYCVTVFFKLSDIIESINSAAAKAHSEPKIMVEKYGYKLSNCLRLNPIVKEKLYNVLKKAVDIPVLEEWLDYLFANSTSISLHPCQAYYSDINNPNNLFCCDVNIEKKSLENAISRALSQELITIRNSVAVSDSFEHIHNLTDYLKYFSDQLIAKAATRFSAIFDPNSEEFTEREKDYFDFTSYNGSLKFFNTQMNVIGAINRALDKDKSALLVGEMGCGISV